MIRPARPGLPLRRVLFWCHLAVGAVVGIVVLIMSATGVALAYERQLFDWVARRHAVAPPSPGAERLPLDTLAARARAAGRGKVVALTVHAEPTMPVLVGVEGRRTLYLDPYTGAVTGSDSVPRAMFTDIQRWHRSLAMGAAMRAQPGAAITGAANVAFLFLILSGLYLWWPRRFSASAFRSILLFAPRARGRARDWNWHHVLGFWCGPVLVLIVVTGAFISYQWPEAILNRIVGAPEHHEERRGGERRNGAERPPAGPRASLDAVWSLAVDRVQPWRSIQIRFPRSPDGPLTASIMTGTSGRPDQRVRLAVDAATGAVVEWQTYESLPANSRIRSWVRGVHTGEAGGIIGQTIAAIASLAGVVLVYTGLALAWRRLRGRDRSIRRNPPAPLAPPSTRSRAAARHTSPSLP